MKKFLNNTLKTLSFVSIIGSNLTFSISYAQNIIPNNDGIGTQVNLNGNIFNINGGTISGQNLFHSFQQFGLDNGQIANFLAQPNIVNILSRINGGNSSVINGIINSNANLFLMNPAGIIFGQNASLNINGDFTATTATGIGFNNGWFNSIGTVDYANLIGNPVSFNFDNTKGIIYNAADLEVLTGKNLSLIGNTVINEGKLSANNGNILVTAVPGTGLLNVSFPNSLITWEISAPTDEAGNLTNLTTENFLNAIRGQDIGKESPLNSSLLNGESGINIVTGEINSAGGKVQILGDKIELFGAKIDVSNHNNAGQILIGGNVQGQGKIPTANQTIIDSNTTIKADGIDTGNGGQVVIFSNNYTNFTGEISAKGGENGGNGGFVELSSKGFLGFTGNVNASTANGQQGSLLIDPKNIIVTDSEFQFDVNDATFNNAPDQDSIIRPSQITDITNTGTAVTLQANNDITVNSPIISNNFEVNGGDLSLQAGRSININADINTGNGNLNLIANETAINGVIDEFRDPGNAEIKVADGIKLDTGLGDVNITLSTGEGLTNKEIGNLTLGDINANNITVTNTGLDIIINGNLTTHQGQNSGNIALNAATNITVNGEINSSSANSISGIINITSQTGNITLNDVSFGSNIGIDNPLNINTLGEVNLLGELTPRGSTINIGNVTPVSNFSSLNLINTQGGDFNLNTSENYIFNSNLFTLGGNANIKSNGDLTINSNLQMDSGNLNFESVNLDITNANIETNSGDITLTATNNIIGQDIDTQGGDININGGDVTLENLVTSDDLGEITNSSGEVNINANKITVSSIDTRTAMNSSSNINAGNINVIAENDINIQGSTTRGNSEKVAISSSVSEGGLGNAGNINIDSKNGNINLLETDTRISATTPTNNVNNSGKITLSAINGEINLPESIEIRNFSNNGNSAPLEIKANSVNGNNLNLISSEGFDLSNLNLSGNLDILLNDIDNITNTGTIKVLGKLTFEDLSGNNSNLLLDNPNNDFNTVTIISSQETTLNDINNIVLDGVNSNNLTVIAQNDISQTDKITTQQLTLNTQGNITIENSQNDIDQFNLTGKDIKLTYTNDVNLNQVTSETLIIDTTGNINQINQITANQANLTATGNINLGNSSNKINSLTAIGTEVSVNNSQDLTLNGIESNTLTVNTIGNINQINQITANQANLTATGDINLENSQNQINSYTLNAGNNVTLTNPNDININELVTNGGDINVTGNNINAENSLISNGGNVNLKADQNITTNAINSSNEIGTGGDITIESINITTGNLDSSGESGGNITMKAENTITTGSINSIGNIGNGGNVNLNTTVDIQVVSINTEGRENGQGGNIDIETDKFFRATGTFINSNGQNASISTIGSNGGGSITIKHGGQGQIPFIIGDANINGTAGIITSGTTQFNEASFLFTTRQDNIAIISVDGDTQPVKPPVEPDFEDFEANPAKIANESINNSFPNLDLANFQKIQIKTLKETEEILSEIQSETGAKPALIYVRFAPKNISLAQDFSQREAQLSNEFEQHLNPNKKSTTPIISVEEKDSDILELIIVTKNENIRYMVEDATKDKVLLLNGILRKEINNPSTGTQRLLASSKRLYDWLIKPLESDLNRLEINNLVFVMDTGLRSLPLAALYDGNGYIIEKYSVGLMPSISLVDTRYVPLKDLAILGMGAETFTNQNPLPAVPTELKIITSQIWKGQSFLNQDFTIDNLKKARKTAPVGILHLATHGEFNSGSAENSYIQFEDRRLNLSEIYQLRLNTPQVELLVLSACKTALGDNDAELGFAGLAHQAGVKTALGSLWYVSDEGTLGLMSSFYQNLQTAPIKAEALRKAQLAMLRGEVRLENGRLVSGDRTFDLPESLIKLGNKDLKHPYFWSAFTMIGNPW